MTKTADVDNALLFVTTNASQSFAAKKSNKKQIDKPQKKEQQVSLLLFEFVPKHMTQKQHIKRKINQKT